MWRLKKVLFAFYFNSKAEIIINRGDVDGKFPSVYTTIISNIQTSLGNALGWIIHSIIDHTVSISKYHPLAGSRYIKLPKGLDHPRKGLIDIQKTGNIKWFKLCLVGD